MINKKEKLKRSNESKDVHILKKFLIFTLIKEKEIFN